MMKLIQVISFWLLVRLYGSIDCHHHALSYSDGLVITHMKITCIMNLGSYGSI